MKILLIKFVLFLYLIAFPSHSFAQKDKAIKNTFNLTSLSLKAAYYGETLRHPGMLIGIDYALFKNSWFSLHSDADLGFYVHRWNHIATFFKLSIGTRYTTNDGILFDFNIGAGYLHTFPDGTVYKKDNSNNLIKAASTGYPHFMPTVSFLFGWDASKRTKLPFSIYFGPEVFLEYPFNHGILPHAVITVGILYSLKKNKNV